MKLSLLFLSLLIIGCGNPINAIDIKSTVTTIGCPDGTTATQVPVDMLPPGYPVTFICVPTSAPTISYH